MESPADPLTNYYGPLLANHVKIILESGLLLDEDYEVLLRSSNFKIYPNKSSKLPLGLIAGALTTLSSIYVAKRYDLPIVVFPTLTATLCLVYFEIRSISKRRRRKEAINYLVGSFIRLQKLYTSIRRYMKMRKELSSNKENEDLLIHSKNNENFLKSFLERNREFLKVLLSEVKFLTDLTNELSDDFEGLKEIDIEAILKTDNLSCNDYAASTAKVQDVYTFLSSKFLNYLGVTFCKYSANINAKMSENLLDKKVPCVNENLRKVYCALQKEFNNLRYCTSKKTEIDLKNKRVFNRHVSGKLQQAVIGAVNNLSIIMEKSQAVLQKVETTENADDVKKLESALSDLRDHAFAAYESLDVLCKLYGIFAEASKKQVDFKRENEIHPKGSINVDSDARKVNFDDDNEPLEENYELFIPENEQLSIFNDNENYVDQSSAYANLMLKELRQSLKQHERFVAARNKRGIKDDDDDDDDINLNREKRKERNRSPPKFDMSACKVTSESDIQKNLIDAKDKSTEDLVFPSKPAPPPPPPPSLKKVSDLEDSLEDKSNVLFQQRSFLEKIKVLSSQVQGNEDVFGDEDLSDSSSKD